MCAFLIHCHSKHTSSWAFLLAVASRYISDQCMWTYSMFFPGTHTCKALSVGTYGWSWGMRLARWNGRCMIWFGWITDWFFVIRGTGPQVNVPFSGYTSSLWVNLTPFPPWTGERDAEKYTEKLRAVKGIWEMESKKDRQKRKKERDSPTSSSNINSPPKLSVSSTCCFFYIHTPIFPHTCFHRCLNT